ncbi:hypothetical protein [Paraburkholderia unamae]|uniref:Uncharacterized protein n=1 Tax=Paraburkholderia unamae TaxID=219649 RepID=A0ABX5KZ00_9BURK|nr:hypothetical protein [Paraburkholderia unamae]PVX97675.1 hypothetical protein C7402_101389 [Paraburkholderia unamae]
MPAIRFIHLPPRPGPLLKGLGFVTGVTAISIAAALCYEQYKKRELVRTLASMPGAGDILPALRTHSEMVLAQFGVGVAPTSDTDGS